MSLLNPEQNLLHNPSNSNIMNPSQVVFSLKQRPPINFNITLKQYAMQHGLNVHFIGFHPHTSGSNISLKLSGSLENAKRFANSAISRFNVYINHATVQFGNQFFKF